MIFFYISRKLKKNGIVDYFNLYSVRYWLLNHSKLRLHEAAIHKKTGPWKGISRKVEPGSQDPKMTTLNLGTLKSNRGAT